MFAEQVGSQATTTAFECANFAGLVGNHRGQKTVPITEPFVEAFLGTVGGPREAGCGQRFFATLDQETQCLVQNNVLARRKFLR